MVCIIVYVLLAVYFTLQKKKKLPEYCYGQIGKQVFCCLAAANTLALLLFIVDAGGERGKRQKEIVRNEYGKGVKTEDLEVTIDGKTKKEPIQIQVQERNYTKAETEKLFAKAMRELDDIILGKNKSKDRVEQNLNLIKKFPETPIEIEWALDKYEVMNIYGELQNEKLKKEGTLVEVRGILRYKEEEALYVTNVMVYPHAETGSKKVVMEVEELVKESDRSTKEEKKLILPTKWNGENVIWTKKKEQRGYAILGLGIAAAGFLILLKKQNDYKAKQEKRQQMMLDYPEIVNKFMLLLGAGMTVKNAWKKIVSDYLEQREAFGIRYAYEEMNCTLHEMLGGITEANGYERFGRRCGLQSYLKLGALLAQNLRKGTKGLTELLDIEAIQAFEERKNLAKKLGEEAGTKLLLPMFFMLAVVLVIVIVPAFLSVQM